MASCIINQKWYSETEDKLVDESMRIVIAAARLVKAQIREMVHDMDTYPLTTQFEDVETGRQWVPNLLEAFMRNVVCDDLKQVALSHCIVQAARPRSIISPITFGLGVSLDHMLGSQWLLNTLARLGLSVSYDEVYRFKQSAMQSDIGDMPKMFPSGFTQFSGDNVDHNVTTLDGSGGFHGMGIISMTTPMNPCIVPVGTFSNQAHAASNAMPRLKRLTVDKLTSNRGIPILHYHAPATTALSQLILKSLDKIQPKLIESDSNETLLSLDMAWHSAVFFEDEFGGRPNWSGFMQDVTSPITSFHPVTEICMLPIIDLNPNDMTCIFSTLSFIEKQSKTLNMW